MKRLLVIICALVLAAVAVQAVGYVAARNSDAYAEAQRFVRTDQSVVARLGKVSEVSLSPWDSELKFTGNTGQASFVVSVTSERGLHRIMVKLEKTANGWSVVSSSVL